MWPISIELLLRIIEIHCNKIAAENAENSEISWHRGDLEPVICQALGFFIQNPPFNSQLPASVWNPGEPPPWEQTTLSYIDQWFDFTLC